MEKKKLMSISDWVKSSLSIYFKKENFIYLTKFALLQLLLYGVFYAGMFIFGSGLGVYDFETGVPNAVGFFVFLLVGAVLMIVLGVWIYAATVHAVSQVLSGTLLGVKETFKKTRGRIFPYLLMGLLSGIIVIFGFVLLIIPGIIFMVWIYFAQYFVVVENKGPIAAVKASRELVRGYFWAVLGRAVVAMIYMAILGMLFSIVLSFVGSILLMLLYPYYYLFSYLLYRNLKEVKS